MTTLTAFLERLDQRPLPANPMARIKAFARELAEGAAEGLWETAFYTQQFDGAQGEQVEAPEPTNLQDYIRARWGALGAHPSFNLLIRNEFISQEDASRFNRLLMITRTAFALLEEADTARIFISYKRTDSSAFALLVNTVLKHAGLTPFLDMQLVPGANWRDELERHIRNCDYFVLLIGPQTLTSQVTLEEIGLALQHQLTILPIWHNGFSFRADQWPNLPAPVQHILATTHTVRVLEENPLAYQAALSQLLNYFGLTP